MLQASYEMRSKFLRRRSTPHAERGVAWKRQTTLEIHPVITSSGGFVLTAPTTITVLETITETASSSSATGESSSSRRSESSVTTTSSSTEPSIFTSSASTTSLQTPSETATSTTSSPTISPTDGNNNGTISLGTGALSATQVPAGAIVAIVIACLIVIVVGLFYLIRLKSRRDRKGRRPQWLSGMNSSSGRGASATSYPSVRSQPRMQFTTPPPPPPMPPMPRSVDPTPTVQIPGPNVTVPPRSYNSAENNNIDPVSSSSNLDLISTPKAVYTLGMNGKRSAFSATVTSTFITTLPDELSIQPGERLRVVAEYDDGWSLCMNVRGEQGMVPIECLDRRRQPELREGVSMSSLASTAESSSQSWRASRRVSSLRP